MIDIHCHLLPNIDDGPTSWEESLELARMYDGEGIQTAVTTPHWIKGSPWEPDPNQVIEMVGVLNEKTKAENIPLKILPGMEVGMTDNLIELLNNRSVLTLGGGSHILLESPFTSMPYKIEELIVRLKHIGITTILAHPERCQEVQSNPKRLESMVESGALIQITSSSLLGHFGLKPKVCATWIARHGLIHLIASDAHSPTNRPPLFREPLSILREIIGPEATRTLEERTYNIISNNNK
jgi:protein-tyrosine phosphatase